MLYAWRDRSVLSAKVKKEEKGGKKTGRKTELCSHLNVGQYNHKICDASLLVKKEINAVLQKQDFSFFLFKNIRYRSYSCTTQPALVLREKHLKLSKMSDAKFYLCKYIFLSPGAI